MCAQGDSAIRERPLIIGQNEIARWYLLEHFVH